MSAEHSRKPAGGYILFQATQLLSAWEAYRTKIIRLVDLRVWFACHELVARRQGAQAGRRVRYTLGELRALVGGGPDRALRGSLNRLERAAMVQWSAAGIAFPKPTNSVLERTLPGSRRLVPVPRRAIRFIAGGTTRAMTATMLGLLLRCVFYRRGVCTSDGTCKASWVACTFGVDERSVKRARARLLAHGWVESVGAAQWRMNRWGGMYRVNLDWSGSPPERSGMTPLTTPIARRLSPPESDKEPLREYNHQNPAVRGPGGARRPENTKTAPTLKRIQPEDLHEPPRLLALHAQACARALADPSEAGRLRFIALATHARRYATRNAPGLFAWLLRERKWGFITQEDEDLARGSLLRAVTPQSQNRPRVIQRDWQSVGAVLDGLLAQGPAGPALIGVAYRRRVYAGAR